MVAIVHWMADREDWMLGAELQVARKELCEAKEWLATIQKRSVPPSPRKKTPTRQELTNPPDSQRGESEVGDQGEKVRGEADAGKTSTPPWSKGKWGSKVSEADQIEHLWAGGQWEGLSAVCKGGEIWVEVHLSQCGIENGWC